jgi:acetyl esterase/lipase
VNANRRSFLAGTLATVFGAGARAGTPAPGPDLPVNRAREQPKETIDLWPGDAPGMPDPGPVETVEERDADPVLPNRAVRGIAQPRLVVFRPRTSNGAAVMVMPGGGYEYIVIDKEGYELGRWLSARGFTVFVLFYRLPGEGWAHRADVPLSDAQRAMRLIRHRAPDHGIDPQRVAAMGFSAGGHLCADLATRFATKVYEDVDAADTLSARPFAAAPIYPVISMSAPLAHSGSRDLLLGPNAKPEFERVHSPQLNISGDVPPCFLVHAEDDDVVPVENTLVFRAALVANGISVETHLFAEGGHGFGLQKVVGKPAAVWPELFFHWALAKGLA